jgi:hypothetical protein
MDIQHAVDLLEEWSCYENTEIGDTWKNLIGLWSNRDYITNNLSKHLEEEIILEATEAKNNYEVVTQKETFERTVVCLKPKENDQCGI